MAAVRDGKPVPAGTRPWNQVAPARVRARTAPFGDLVPQRAGPGRRRPRGNNALRANASEPGGAKLLRSASVPG